MRTTLDIDDRLLAAARSRARLHGTTIGQEVSRLGLAGLAPQASEDSASTAHGLVLLPATGRTFTSEDVAEALEDE